MNYLHRWIIVGITSASVCGASFAATQVQRSNAQGQTETLTMQGSQARMDSPDPNHYMLINLDKEKVYMVDHNQDHIVYMDIIGTPPELPKNMPKPPPQQPVNARLIKKRSRAMIAGYPTVKYLVKANGKRCFKNYFSKEAATELANVKKFFDAMSSMAKSRQIKGMAMPPCLQAHNDLQAQMKNLGMSMKMLITGRKGNKLMYKIVSIKTDVDVPANIFNLPTGYKMISEQAMRQEGLAKMKAFMEQKKQRGERPHRFPPRSRRDRDWRDENRQPRGHTPPWQQRDDHRQGDYMSPPWERR